MKKNRGFTLIELVIVVAIIGIVVTLIGGFIFRGCASSQGTAESEAREFGKSLGLQMKGVSCASRDTDRDGYVSCTISHTENGSLQMMPVECAARWTMNDGCKAQRIGYRRGLW